MNIARRLKVLALINLGILLGFAYYTNSSMGKVADQLSDVATTQLPATRALALTDMYHDGIRGAVYRAFLARDENNNEELQLASEELERFSQDIQNQLTLVGGLNVSAESKKKVNSTLKRVDDYKQVALSLVKLLRENKAQEALAGRGEFQKAFSALETELEELGTSVEAETSKALEDSSSASRRNALIFACISATLSVLLTLLINRQLMQSLTNVTSNLGQQKDALHENSARIEASSHTLRESVDEQASVVEQTAAAVEQISAMIRQTTTTMQVLEQSAVASREAIDTGRQTMTQMRKGMQSIDEANQNLLSEMQRSTEHMRSVVNVINNIGEKTRIINDIVTQTKLLSFNASVEAARAGEHGKGFAVVAQEIGQLAQLSGKAASEITLLIDEGCRSVESVAQNSQASITRVVEESVEKGVRAQKVVNDCDRVFQSISSQFEKVHSLSGEISESIKEEAKGLHEINQAIQSFNRATQRIANSAHDASSLAQAFKEQFQAFQLVLQELDSLVGEAAAKRAA